MSKIGIVFFADDWGYTKGGINSFNFDLCNALGMADKKDDLVVFCICKNAVSQQQKSEASSHNVNIISINETDFDSYIFEGLDFENLFKHLKKCFAVYSVGHDIITSDHARAFRNQCIAKNIFAKLVVFHHMDYEAYYGASNSGEKVKAKKDKQEAAFKEADYLIAVGPKLFKSLEDKKIDFELNASIDYLIPGLTHIEPIKGKKNRTKILQVGRIESNNNGIKQYGIVIDAFSHLYDDKIMDDGSNLVLLGVDESSGENVEKDIKNHASKLASQYVNILGLKYIDNRDKVLNEYRTSSIVTMPSLSEGFGLVALEAISAGVPLILTKNSGIYEFLKDSKLDNYVTGIDVKGSFNGEVNSDDVNEMHKALKTILLDYDKHKKDSLKLRTMLNKKGYTWDRTAQQFLEITGIDKLLKYRFLFNLLPFQNFDSNEAVIMAEKAVKKYQHNLKPIKSGKVSIDYYVADAEEFKNQLQKNGKYDDNTINFFLRNVINEFLLAMCDYLGRDIESNSGSIESMLHYDYDSRLAFVYSSIFGDEWEYEDDYVSFNINIRQHLFPMLFNSDERKIISEINCKQQKEYQYVDLKGLSKSVSNDEAALIPLNKIYAEVTIKSKKDDEKYSVAKGFAKRLIKFKRTVVLGDPGTGKSTLVQKTVLELCDESNAYSLCCIPIKIADLSVESTNGNVDLDKYITSKYFGIDEKNNHLFQKLKKYGYLFVLLDGYDETKNEKEKEDISNSICELLKMSPGSSYLATSRIVGYNYFFEKHDFSTYEMQPLSETSIEEFISLWFNVVSFDDDTELLKNKNKGNKLKKLLEADSTLMELSKNPLLLTIIVILQYHGITPPTDKGKLYEVIIETLLQSWIERKGSLIKEYQIDFLTGLFSEIAYKMVDENYSTLTIDEKLLRKVCTSYMINNPAYSSTGDINYAVDTFIKYVSESVGILLKRGDIDGLPCYSFLIHRQFTEYFAAIKLESKNEDEDFEIEDYISEPKWIEVLILMFSFMNNQQLGGQKRANRLIEKLMIIKSPHIDDLNYNYQMLLKIMINNVIIFPKSKTLAQDFIKGLFNNANRYRFKQFLNELLLLYSSNYKDIITNVLEDDIDYDNKQSFENSLLYISNLYKQNSEKEINSLIDGINSKCGLYALFFEGVVLKRKSNILFSEDNYTLHTFAQQCFSQWIKLLEQYDYNEEEYEHALRFLCYYSPVKRARYTRYQIEDVLSDISARTGGIKNHKIKQDLNRMMVLHYLVNDALMIGGNKNDKAIINVFPECEDVLDCFKEFDKDFRLAGSMSILHGISGYLYIFPSKSQCTIRVVTIQKDKVISSKIIIKDSIDVEEFARYLEDQHLESLHYLKGIASNFGYRDKYKKISAAIQKWLLNKGIIVKDSLSKNHLDIGLLDDKTLIDNYDELMSRSRYGWNFKSSGKTVLASIICKLLTRNGASLNKKERDFINEMYEKYKNQDGLEKGIYYDMLNKVYNPLYIK